MINQNKTEFLIYSSKDTIGIRQIKIRKKYMRKLRTSYLGKMVNGKTKRSIEIVGHTQTGKHAYWKYKRFREIETSGG